MNNPKTHPKNFEIVDKITTAVFLLLQNSIEGRRVLRQQISGLQIDLAAATEYQNVDAEISEPELSMTVLFHGGPSQSLRFKFSELSIPKAPPPEPEVPPLRDETIPTEEGGHAQ